MGVTIATLRRVRVGLFIFAALVCVSPLTSQQTTQQPQVQNTPPNGGFQEEVVGELSPGSQLQSVRITAQRLAWVESQAGKHIVRLDGKQQGAPYEEVKYLRFSPDEQHLVFAAKRNSNWVLMLDGQERSPEYSLITPVTFQPEGASMAYCACEQKNCRLVVDGSASGADYDEITYPKYSSDGRRIAYFGKRGRKWVAVVDGKEFGPEVDGLWFRDWGFSPDGRHLYAAALLKRNWKNPMNRDWRYVVDGTPGPPYAVLSPIAFSRDGKHYAYAGMDAKYAFSLKLKTLGTLLLDGQPNASYQGEGGEWLTGMGGVLEVIVRGVRNFAPDFDGLSNPGFNPEGKLVYAARRDQGDVAVIVGGEEGPAFEEIVSPVIFTSHASTLLISLSRVKILSKCVTIALARNSLASGKSASCRGSQ